MIKYTDDSESLGWIQNIENIWHHRRRNEEEGSQKNQWQSFQNSKIYIILSEDQYLLGTGIYTVQIWVLDCFCPLRKIG